MRKSLHQTLSILAICLLLSQAIFGSLPVFAQTNSDALTITMTENGQPYTEGSVATSPVTIQVVTTSPDSAGIELSQDLGTTWKPYDTAEPLVLEDAGDHDIWVRLTDSDEQAVIEKRHIQIKTAALLSRQATGPVIYVDANSTAANGGDGTSWATAYKDLQAALSAAGAGKEIWIAKGTYKPTKLSNSRDPRTASFQMKNGVAIYGGFAGSETTPAERDARDFKTNETILSGDIGSVGNKDNAYSVFYHPTGLNLDKTAILDGVTITRGNTNGASYPRNGGGGMHNFSSSPTVTNVVFRDNESYNGGGMFNNSSSPTVTNVTFHLNTASFGGGMSNDSSNPTVTNVTFIMNEAVYGGGMDNYNSSNPTITNVVFRENKAINKGIMTNEKNSSPTLTNITMSGNTTNGTGDKAAIYNAESTSEPKIHNSIIIGNNGPAYNGAATIQNSLIGDDQKGQLYDDVGVPDGKDHRKEAIFIDHTNADYRLKAGSPAIDKGENSDNTTQTDLDGNKRIQGQGCVIDLGAYESKGTVTCHTVTFDSNGGSANAALSVPDKTRISEPTPAPTKAGYTFKGWYKDSGFTNAWDFAIDVVTANVTLYAQWNAIPTYTVTYDGNGATGGQVPPSATHEENVTVTVAGNTGNLVKSNHTFTGWNTQADGKGTAYAAGETFQMGKAAVTLYAQWKAIQTYEVTYNGNGSTGGQAPSSASYEENTTVTVAGNTGNLVNPNHTFTGWNTEVDGTGTAYAAGETFQMGTANVTLYAQWKINAPIPPKPTYTVTYNGNGATSGQVPPSATHEENVTVTVGGNTGNLVKSNHTFTGWNTQADYQGTAYAAGATFQMGTANVTLYAQWKINAPIPPKPTYTVTYNGNGATSGQVPPSATHEENATVTVAGNTGNLVKSNHTFTGWNTQADGQGTAYAAGATFQMGTANVTLYAQWKINAPIPPKPTYTVTYNGNGATSGQVPPSATHEENATVTVAGNTGNLVKPNHIFTGWDTEADGTGTAYATGEKFQMGTANVTLYAQWKANPTYTVTYNGNGATGGQAPSSASYEENATVTVAGNTGNLVKPNHIFTGWDTEADGTGTAYATGEKFQMGTANVTLYAQWKANPTYTVTYNGNGATGGQAPSSASYEENATVTVASNTGNLVKSNHTFTGWNTEADGTGTAYAAGATFQMGKANVTLYAQWKANPTYTVIYNGNGATSGQVPPSATHEENVTVTVAGNTGNLVKSNHTFTGWNTQADGQGTAYAAGATFQMGTANVTLYAQWKADPPTSGGDTTPPPTSSNDSDNTYSPPTTVKITLHSNDGTIIEPINITYNTKVSDLPVPTRAGFRFEGWYEDEALTKRWADGTLVRENISLYAKWTALPAVEPEPETKPETPQEPQPPTLPQTTVTFGDVEQHWAQEMIEELATLGIIQGFEDGTFRPNAPISRMHVAALLTRAFPFENVREGKDFSDVSPTHPYYDAILTLQQAGIIDGTNGAFLPKENMTRAELAKVLVGVLGFTPEGTASFSDVASTHWSTGYIAVLEREGIALGDNGKYSPNDPVTRAQFVAFLYRILQLQKQ